MYYSETHGLWGINFFLESSQPEETYRYEPTTATPAPLLPVSWSPSSLEQHESQLQMIPPVEASQSEEF
jgi:hypothetical protein